MKMEKIKPIPKYIVARIKKLDAKKHPEIKWGFVRAVGSQIYMSNTEWDENVMNGDVWKPIEEFIDV